MERVWWRRLRWRLRGAWLWPTFITLSILDGLLLHALPISGDATHPLPGMLLGALLNLLAVTLLAPLLGSLWRRREPALPKVVAHDRAGTAIVAAVSIVLLGAGLAHRPAVRESQRDAEAQAEAVRRYVMASARPEYRAHLAASDTVRLDTDLYRTCVPGRDPRRGLCLLVDTSRSPAGVHVDPDNGTNRSYETRSGPG